ncbi:hypothetical protein ACU52_02460 [Xylanibacter rarus]|uniref:Uncharacterized protein n=1 Tax=Xylanibacter rarus TaxID=1676614 RepID=A0A8E1QZ57_9BACT|nr:hypothetical protein ACU52_02460 [Xylanibacter rarus]
MKATIYILSILTLILGGVAVALGLQPTLGQTDSKKTSTDTGCMRGSSLLAALTARDMRPLRW